MLLEELEEGSTLRLFGEEIRSFIEGLGATVDQPRGDAGCHTVRRGNSLFLTFRFAGTRAQVFPKNSLVLYAPWSDSFQIIPAVRRGLQTWYHGPSAELGVAPEQGEAAKQFIQLAYDQAQS